MGGGNGWSVCYTVCNVLFNAGGEMRFMGTCCPALPPGGEGEDGVTGVVTTYGTEGRV